MKLNTKFIAMTGLLSVLGLAVEASAQSQRANTSHAHPKSVAYNYAGVRYISQNLDEWDCTQDGLNIYGSLDLNSGYFAQAGFTDVSGGGCGSTTVMVQGGYRTAFNDKFFMYGTLGFESLSVDAGGSDSGLVLAGGLRGFVTANVETQFEVSHHTVGDGDTGVSGMVNYWLAPNMALTAGLDLSANGTAFSIGGRLNF